jgi:hypothetical protein
VLTLEAPDLQHRVRAAVEQHRGELERLVEEEVNRLVAELVAERIATGNGHTELVSTTVEIPNEAQAREPAVTKICARCGEAKASTQYAAGRATCKACRRKQERERIRRRQSSAGEASAAPLAGGGSASPTSAIGEGS